MTHNFIFPVIMVALCLPGCSPKTTESAISNAFPPVKENEITNPIAIGSDQQDSAEYFRKDFLRYSDYVYMENIRTVMLHREGHPLTQPVAGLNSDTRLMLSFDDLDGKIKNYYYTLIHCTWDWQPSGLAHHEFITGFPDNQITDYQQSFNTLQHYTHYSVVLPNNAIRFIKSGNYIIKVYEKDNPESVVITKRFIITEPLLSIIAQVKRATSIDDRNYKQEVDFTINQGEYTIDDPYENLKVVVMQNNRWDNAVRSLKPFLVKGTTLIYDYDDENVFTAGNEFRYFDITSLRVPSERVENILHDSVQNHIQLFSDSKRSFRIYLTYSDINGRYFIRNDFGGNSDTEADYCFVHFSLPYEAPMIDGNFFILGALTQWNFTEEGKMKYNYFKKQYETVLYLKQGLYNYAYVFLKDGETAGDDSFIEGTHYDTENEYAIYVYHRATGATYDRLAGYVLVNSRQK